MNAAVFGMWRTSSHSGNEGNCVELAWRKSSFSANESNCVELAWQKSSFSGDEGNCVELAWRKSSFSADESNCVELARGAIRDSKNPEAGHLGVSLAGLIALAKSS